MYGAFCFLHMAKQIRIKKGDVLFGKRRAYLKTVTVG